MEIMCQPTLNNRARRRKYASIFAHTQSPSHVQVQRNGFALHYAANETITPPCLVCMLPCSRSTANVASLPLLLEDNDRVRLWLVTVCMSGHYFTNKREHTIIDPELPTSVRLRKAYTWYTCITTRCVSADKYVCLLLLILWLRLLLLLLFRYDYRHILLWPVATQKHRIQGLVRLFINWTI